MTDDRSNETPLESWKEIATYLKRDVRTVTRWEKKEGLPVHRHLHHSRASVYAYPSELDAWRAHREPATEPRRPAWWRPVPAFASTIALAIALMTAGSGPPVGAAAQAADGSGITLRQVWADPDVDGSGGPSPDGRYLSYVDWDTGDIAILDIATGGTRRLTTERSAAESGAYGYSPVWSPDGSEVAYSWRERELRVIGVDGSPPRVIAEHRGAPLAWFPNAGYLLTLDVRSEGLARFYRIQRVALADGSVRTLRDLDLRMPGPPSVSLSPDGQYIAFDCAQEEASERRDIFAMAADGSQHRELVAHPADDRLLGWAPDGSIVFSSDRTGDRDAWLLPMADGKANGPPSLVKKEIGEITPVGFTQSGSYFYARSISGQDVYIAELDPESGELIDAPERPTEMWPGGTVAPEWSPDGEYLAYVNYRKDRDSRIFIRSLSTGVERELPSPVAKIENTPKWSLDGQSLLVVGERSPSDRGGYVVNIETGKASHVIDLDGKVNPNALWSPDSETIFYSYRDFPVQSGRIVKLNVRADSETTLWSHDGFVWPLWMAASPDGSELAFTLRTQDGPGKPHLVMVLPTAGGEPREIARMEDSPIATESLAWTPDGRYVMLVHASRLWRVAVAGGDAEEIADFSVRPVLCLRLHPGGRRVAFTAGGSHDEIWVMENFLPQTTAAQQDR